MRNQRLPHETFFLRPITRGHHVIRWSDGSGHTFKKTIHGWPVMKKILFWFLTAILLILVYWWGSVESNRAFVSLITVLIIAGGLAVLGISCLFLLLVKVLTMLEDYLEKRQHTGNLGKRGISNYVPQSIAGRTVKGGRVRLEKQWKKYK